MLHIDNTKHLVCATRDRSPAASCFSTFCLLSSHVALVLVFVGLHAHTDVSCASDIAPPPVLEGIHSKARLARDRGDFEAVEALRVERLTAVASLPASSAWKQGLDAIGLADQSIHRMQYREAVATLKKAWEPFNAASEAKNGEILFGDIALKLFEAMQAAAAVYKLSDDGFPSMQTEELRRLVDAAYESDPCQVELRAIRAFLTQPDTNETFLPQARRNSITRRNEDLLAIAYPEGRTVPIRQWHGPVQYLLGKNSSYVIRDLRFMRYLDARTRIRGKDQMGEAFNFVYGGSILCYGVSGDESQQPGRSQVRFYVDDYRDDSWHRLRPYFLYVEPCDTTEKTRTDEWTLRSTEVQARFSDFERKLSDAETSLNRQNGKPVDGTPALPAVVTDNNIIELVQPIVNRFRGKRREQVQQATTLIIAGQWQQPAADGTPPPPQGAPLHDRLVFLAKGFRAYGKANPTVAAMANDAADDVEMIASRTANANTATPANPATDTAGSRSTELFSGAILSSPLPPSQALERIKHLAVVRDDWETRSTAVRTAGAKNVSTEDIDTLIDDYRLLLGCRAIEHCLYLRRQAFQDSQSAYGSRDDDFKTLFGPDYTVVSQDQILAPEGALRRQDLTATLRLLESTPVLDSLRRDLRDQKPSPAQSPLQLTEEVRKDALTTVDTVQQLFTERSRNLRARELQDITVDRPLFRRWATPEARWSLYEIPHTIPPTIVADFLDNPLIPTIGVSEEAINQLAQGREEVSVDPDKISVALVAHLTLGKGTPLVRLGDASQPPTLKLRISKGQLPLIAAVLVSHAADDGDGGAALDDEKALYAETPEPHRIVHAGDDFKSEFDGCDGLCVAGFGKGRRRLVDRRGNTITLRSPGENTPFTVVSPTKQDISDGGDNVVYSWNAWRDLDQNIINDFLPSTELYSPSLPVWMTYREELLRPSPALSFRWGAARSSYYRQRTDWLDEARQKLGW